MARFGRQAEPLLGRAAFKSAVFGASGGRCAEHAAPAVDAHHILERKLFADGGYYLSNGAAVCEQHHWACETAALAVGAVREAARVFQSVLPDGFDPACSYDKWGNRLILSGPWRGYRGAGPLAADAGMLKALTAGGLRGRFVSQGLQPLQEHML